MCNVNHRSAKQRVLDVQSVYESYTAYRISRIVGRELPMSCTWSIACTWVVSSSTQARSSTMSKALESVSALIAISSSDLSTVTGGQRLAEPTGGSNPAPPVPQLPACPTGTSPDFTYINGNLNVKTPV